MRFHIWIIVMATKRCRPAANHRTQPYLSKSKLSAHTRNACSTSQLCKNKITSSPQLCSKQSETFPCEDDHCQIFPCISARQPYAGLILNGYKTIETRWTPVFAALEHQTVAIHIAWKYWEGTEWREILEATNDFGDDKIEQILAQGDIFGRGIVAGLVDIGKTWKCAEDRDGDKYQQWESAALLRPLQDKFLTQLTNARWLLQPIKSKGQKGIWNVKIPTDYL